MVIDKEALRSAVLEVLRPVQDPEIGVGIVDLGLVYDVDVNDEAEIRVKMTLTSPACPYGEVLLGMAHRAAEEVEGVRKVEIHLVWDPPWNPKEMCSDEAKDQLGIW